MNLTRLWAWRPAVSEGFAALRSLLTASSSLSQRELAVIVCATASSRGDSYCSLAWGERLAAASDGETAAAVLRAAESSSMTERERALAAWARKPFASPSLR
jgi:hypothetical protein